ncbi:hypothetical protein V2J09_005432 [Rumex salicifolius]
MEELQLICAKKRLVQETVNEITSYYRQVLTSVVPCLDLKVKRITPRHLRLAIHGYEELGTDQRNHCRCRKLSFLIHKSLINKSTRK